MVWPIGRWNSCKNFLQNLVSDLVARSVSQVLMRSLVFHIFARYMDKQCAASQGIRGIFVCACRIGLLSKGNPHCKVNFNIDETASYFVWLTWFSMAPLCPPPLPLWFQVTQSALSLFQGKSRRKQPHTGLQGIRPTRQRGSASTRQLRRRCYQF